MVVVILYVIGKVGMSFGGFVNLIVKMCVDMQYMNLFDIVEYIVCVSGFVDFYQGECEGQDCFENLQEFVNVVIVFIVEEGYGLDMLVCLILLCVGVIVVFEFGIVMDDLVVDVFDFVLFVDFVQNFDMMMLFVGFLLYVLLEVGDNQVQVGQDVVQLMMVYVVKGFEFLVVFIMGFEEGLFLYENSVFELDGFEEECWLMYVVIMCVKEWFYLLFV